MSIKQDTSRLLLVYPECAIVGVDNPDVFEELPDCKTDKRIGSAGSIAGLEGLIQRILPCIGRVPLVLDSVGRKCDNLRLRFHRLSFIDLRMASRMACLYCTSSERSYFLTQLISGFALAFGSGFGLISTVCVDFKPTTRPSARMRR